MKNYKGFRLPPASTCNVEDASTTHQQHDEQELQGKNSIIIASICGTCDQEMGLKKITIYPTKCGEYTYADCITLSE